MKFVYQKYLGEFQERELVNWTEEGNYIQGVCTSTHAFRTFRKDRIASYVDGSERLLKNSKPTVPPSLPPKRPVPIDRRREAVPPGVPQILFTGFAAAERAGMEQRAWEAGLYVRKNGVTKDLTFLCTGPNAGPMKVKLARAQGTYIVPDRHFATLIETGELPEEE
jgi:hypothetical protein